MSASQAAKQNGSKAFAAALSSSNTEARRTPSRVTPLRNKKRSVKTQEGVVELRVCA